MFTGNYLLASFLDVKSSAIGLFSQTLEKSLYIDIRSIFNSASNRIFNDLVRYARVRIDVLQKKPVLLRQVTSVLAL